MIPDEQTMDSLKRMNAGGVILFKDNYESPGQVAEFCNHLQRERGELPPFFISVDHEGGQVWRFKDLTHFPPMEKIGKLDSPKLTFEIHEVMAEELSSIGINLDFSPVADVNTNPKGPIAQQGRIFSADPENVAKHASAATRGLQRTGVISCLKHFPGHGDTARDSHFKLPIINKSWEELEKCELIPFSKGIKSKAEMVMTAHILNKGVDPDEPVTFSKKSLDYLRDELRFNGVIISDDLEMLAVAQELSPGERALKALNAGCDQLCVKTLPVTLEAYDYLVQAHKDGKLSDQIIDAAFKRVQDLRKRFAKADEIYVPDVPTKIKTDKALALMEAIETGNVS
jgi:beta-N-acetylhexosaminidase